MAGYFAELQNNIVKRVVSATDKEWCEQNLGGEWVQTYYSTPGKNYAGIGYTYHPEVDNFSSQRPYPSWNLDENLKWVSPVPYPSDASIEQPYIWNEDTLTWDLIN